MVDLRPLNLGDEARLLRWRNDPEIARFMYSDHVISEAEHHAWLKSALTCASQRHWIIELDETPVGLASVTKIDSVHASADWAFYLASTAVRGRGVGSVVEYRVLEFAFLELGLKRLSCAVLAFNGPVIAMHESFGFEREGLLRSAIQKNEERVDVVILSQLQEEWLALRPKIGQQLSERGLL